MNNTNNFYTKNLDTKISDCFPEAENNQTFREYIRESEKWFGMEQADLGNMTEEELEKYIDELDYLWTK